MTSAGMWINFTIISKSNKSTTIFRNQRILAVRRKRSRTRIPKRRSRGQGHILQYTNYPLHHSLKLIYNEQALEWVKSVNDHCLQLSGEMLILFCLLFDCLFFKSQSHPFSGNPKDSPLYNTILSILDSKDKIPYISKIFEHYYNFWQDENHPRGLW